MSKAQEYTMADLMCQSEDCYNFTVKDGVPYCMACYTKKYGRQPCKECDCTKESQLGGYCRQHGIKHSIDPPRCDEDGCTRHRQRGKYCMKHGRERGLYPPAKKRGRKKKAS